MTESKEGLGGRRGGRRRPSMPQWYRESSCSPYPQGPLVSMNCFPPGGIESRLVAAKLCDSCVYFHDREHVTADRCDHCGTLLDGAHSQYVPTLFEMGTVRG